MFLYKTASITAFVRRTIRMRHKESNMGLKERTESFDKKITSSILKILKKFSDFFEKKSSLMQYIEIRAKK